MKTKPSVQIGRNGGNTRTENAFRVQKHQSEKQLGKKATKQATKAKTALQKHIYSIHDPTKGHHLRCAARRWVRQQFKAQIITAQTSNELEYLLRNRQGNEPIMDAEDLSEEAKGTWLRYLEPMAIRAGARLDITVIFSGGGSATADAEEATDEEEGESDHDMLSMESNAINDEVATEGQIEEGGGEMLGPFAFRPKPKEH